MSSHLPGNRDSTPMSVPSAPDATSPAPAGGHPTQLQVPTHVYEAFRVPVRGAVETQLGLAWDYGLRCGEVVISKVASPAISGWSAALRERLSVPGLRLARPLRSTDGRHIVNGYRASAYVEGGLQSRIDETVGAALRLDDALSDVPLPAWCIGPRLKRVGEDNTQQQALLLADQAAWSADPTLVLRSALDENAAADAIQIEALTQAARLHNKLRELGGDDISAWNTQLIHADMLSTTLYHEAHAPLVTDIFPLVRPHGYTAAITIVDSLIVDAVEPSIIERFSHIPRLDDLIVRAALYRLYYYGVHSANQALKGRLSALATVVERCINST